MDETTALKQLDADVALVRRLPSVTSILRLLRQMTSMEFVALARVTEARWLACAVLDDAGFGLVPGSELDVKTTICIEVKRQVAPVAVDDAHEDPRYREHVFFQRYPFRSYIAEPIVLASGECFGTLCAMGKQPTRVSDEKTLALFRHFAEQIASELDGLLRLEGLSRELFDERQDGNLREAFIAVLGHDLRNPLSSISAAAHVQKLRSTDPSAVVGLADRITANVRRMASMVDDLLDLARGRMGGGIRLATAAIEDLGPALEEVVDELRGAHPDREIRSRIELSRPVRGDKVRLQQLVSNLVANAVTHGSANTPIEIAAATSDAGLAIRVHNGGAPIPADSISSIFDAYARPDAPAGRKTGLGLGLYICEQIVIAHGGELAVTSTGEGGTTFTATIPI